MFLCVQRRGCADAGFGERHRGSVCVRDMMSAWAAAELMRQQLCVSCQCHPEGDVSDRGCVSLLPPDSSLTISHATCAVYVFNYHS